MLLSTWPKKLEFAMPAPIVTTSAPDSTSSGIAASTASGLRTYRHTASGLAARASRTTASRASVLAVGGALVSTRAFP